MQKKIYRLLSTDQSGDDDSCGGYIIRKYAYVMQTKGTYIRYLASNIIGVVDAEGVYIRCGWVSPCRNEQNPKRETTVLLGRFYMLLTITATGTQRRQIRSNRIRKTPVCAPRKTRIFACGTVAVLR